MHEDSEAYQELSDAIVSDGYDPDRICTCDMCRGDLFGPDDPEAQTE